MKTIIVKIDKDNLKDDFAVSQLERQEKLSEMADWLPSQRRLFTDWEPML